jgi:hypothetical protein
VGHRDDLDRNDLIGRLPVVRPGTSVRDFLWLHRLRNVLARGTGELPIMVGHLKHRGFRAVAHHYFGGVSGLCRFSFPILHW